MSDAIIVAIISAGVSLMGIVASNKNTRDKISQELKTHQAVTDTKLEHLTEEVKKHNNFATRIPVIEEQIKVANHRIDDLERKG